MYKNNNAKNFSRKNFNFFDKHNSLPSFSLLFNLHFLFQHAFPDQPKDIYGSIPEQAIEILRASRISMDQTPALVVCKIRTNFCNIAIIIMQDPHLRFLRSSKMNSVFWLSGWAMRKQIKIRRSRVRFPAPRQPLKPRGAFWASI
jgi:hypothetical protein